MAVAVPYSPTSQVAPTSEGVNIARPDVPAAAFGSDLGEAVSRFGKAMESSSNELFSRALSIQQLNNETEASEAETQFMIEAGKLHANFNSLEGKERVAAFPKHQQELEELRSSIGGSLSNPASSKLYTTRSRSTLGRTLFNAAGAAASANKQWTTGTVKAGLDMAVKSIGDNPTDETFFNQKLLDIESKARNLSAQMGYGPEQEAKAIQDAKSKAWEERLKSLSRSRPFDAQTLLEKNKTSMNSDDFLKAEAAVKTQVRAVGSTNIANEVWSAGQETPTAKGMSLEQMEAAAEKKAKNIDPDDPILANNAIAAVRTKFNQNKYAQTQEQKTNEQIVLEAIQDGAKNEQELLANPKVADAFQALPPSSPLKKSPLNYTLNKYNTHRDLETMDANWLRLSGLAANDPEGFLNADIGNTQLDPGKRDQLLAARAKMIKQQGGDLRVLNAMSMIKGAKGAEMQALGLYKRDPLKPDDYDKFTGALQGALDTYVRENKKPADYNTIVNEIAPRLMKTTTEPGRWYGTNETQFYKPATHTKDYTDFEKAYQTALPNANAEQTYKAYQRMMYQKFYGKQKAE